MAELYKTKDGKIFDNENTAQAHANKLAIQEQTSISNQDLTRKITLDTFNKMVRAFNASDWDTVIKIYKEETSVTYSDSRASLICTYPLSEIMAAIAYANKNNDYEKAFAAANYGVPYQNESAERTKLVKMAMDAGKKAWAKKHGREITDAEIKQLDNSDLERHIAKKVKDYDQKVVEYGSRNDIGAVGEIRNAKMFLNSYVETWEKRKGIKMTKAEQIRIAGKPFLKGSSSGKRKGKGGIVVVVIIILIAGLYFGRGFLLNKLDGIKNLIPVKTEQTTVED